MSVNVPYSEEYGSVAESGDSDNPEYKVQRLTVFDEILYKVKHAEQKFKKGMLEVNSNMNSFSEKVNGRLYDMDQLITKTLKVADSI